MSVVTLLPLPRTPSEAVECLKPGVKGVSTKTYLFAWDMTKKFVSHQVPHLIKSIQFLSLANTVCIAVAIYAGYQLIEVYKTQVNPEDVQAIQDRKDQEIKYKTIAASALAFAAVSAVSALVLSSLAGRGHLPLVPRTL